MLAPLREWKGERERELEQFEDSIEQKQEEIAATTTAAATTTELDKEMRMI